MSDQCIVLDSSTVIALAKIGLLGIVRNLYVEIVIPRSVYEEVVIKGRGRPGSQELKNLIKEGGARLLAPRHEALVEALHDPLGSGEAEAITLALEKNCAVALDDRIARSKAKSMGLKIIGTVGILRRAYDKGLIEKDTLIKVLKQLRHHGFRISDKIINEALERIERQKRRSND